MQLLSKRFAVKRAKGIGLLELLESFLSKNLAPNETRLRYFIVSAGRKSLSIEVTFLRE